jgi:hypothetical protein
MFEFQIVQTKLDGELTKIKVLDLDEIYNFIVDDFFIWNHLLAQNSIRISKSLKFKFRIVQTKFDGNMDKTKVVDLY